MKPFARAILMLFLLIAINFYICREAFYTETTGHWISMHGQWMELARLSGWHMLGANWWPYCFLGTPVQYVYAPLVPVLTAMLSYLPGSSIPLAFHIITGTVYCLGPVTLYLVSWRWLCAPHCGFFAALIYSLFSPAAWILPDGPPDWTSGLAALRMYVIFAWDDLPHLLSLALMPVAAWLLWRALHSRVLRDCVWPLLVMAAMMLASMFGVVHSFFIVLSVPLIVRPLRVAVFARAAAIGACAYLLICPWVPPSLFNIIRYNAAHNGESDTAWHSLEAVALLVLVVSIVWLVTRNFADEALRWLALFACPAVMIPVLAKFNGPHFVQQPGRYKLEMQLALAWLIPFCIVPLVRRMPSSLRAVLLVPVAAAALSQVASFRQFAIEMTKPVDVPASIEYRVARWLAANMPGQRVLLGGSIERGLNLYADLPQMLGPYTTDENPIVDKAWYISKMAAGGTVRDDSVTWLKALGVQAIGVPGPHSPEFWKPFLNPGKFDGILPVLWREDHTTIYRVPQATTSLAHTVRPDQLVHSEPIFDLGELRRYVAAINDPLAPPASFEWQGTNHARIRSHVPVGDVESVQVDYDAGWHAHVHGAERALQKDGLGMIVIDPQCAGDCEVTLDFDGGVEAKATRLLSLGVLIGLIGAWLLRSVPKPFARIRR